MSNRQFAVTEDILDRLTKAEAKLERLTKAKGYQEGAWLRVKEECKAYALMKTANKRIDPATLDGIIKVNKDDAEIYLQHHINNILEFAVDAFIEGALSAE